MFVSKAIKIFHFSRNNLKWSSYNIIKSSVRKMHSFVALVEIALTFQMFFNFDGNFYYDFHKFSQFLCGNISLLISNFSSSSKDVFKSLQQFRPWSFAGFVMMHQFHIWISWAVINFKANSMQIDFSHIINSKLASNSVCYLKRQVVKKSSWLCARNYFSFNCSTGRWSVILQD